MRTVTRAAVALALALAVVVGAAGAAWATFRGPAADTTSVSTLALAPPTGLARASCQLTGTLMLGRTLTVSFTDSTSEAVVNARPASTPAKALTYNVSVTYSAGTLATGGTSTGSLAASANQFSISSSGGGTRTWTVTMSTAYAGWTSATTTATFSC